VKTGRDYPAGTGYGYLKYPVFRVPDTGNFVHQSDTGRIQDDHYPANTREVRVGYGYPVSGYPLQFLRALCLCVVPACVSIF
jgi:hypothetical protein